MDVAGGTGRLLAQVVAQRSDLRGVLADQEEPVGGAAEVFEAYGVGDRCEAAECNFFEAVPESRDSYILSSILHDWDDESCHRILRRIHQVAARGARFLVLETVLPEEHDGVSAGNAPIHLLDLMMLLNFGARERSLMQ